MMVAEMRSSTRLDQAMELGVALTILSVCLLYSSAFADNFLAKRAVATALGLWLGLMWWLRQRPGMSWLAGSILVAFAMVLLQSLLGAGLARNPAHAGEVWLGYLTWPMLFLVGAHMAADEGRLRRLLRVILSTSLAVAGLALLQFNGIDLIGLPARYHGLPVATLGNTNFVAHYLDLILPLSAALLLPRAIGGRDRWLSVACLVAGTLLLLLSESRGGWVSIGMAGLVVATTVTRPQRWLRRLALVVLCAGLLSPVAEVFLESLPVAGGRTAQDVVETLATDAWDRGASAFDAADFSRSMRILIWTDAWRMARSQGWVGIGPGQWGTELPAYRTSMSHRDWRELIGLRQNQPLQAHQDYLQEWAETGLPGMLMLIGLLAATIRVCWRVAKGRETANHLDPEFRRAMGLAGLGAVVAVCVHALFSFNLRDSVVTTHLWLIAGMAAGAGLPHQVRSAGVWRHFVTGLLLILATLGTWSTVKILIADGHYTRALNYVHQGQGNRATLELREATAWRDYDYRSQHWLGKVSLEMGRPQEALPALRRSLELHPYNAAARRLLVRTAIELNLASAAIEAARQVVKIDPLTVDNYQLLALAHRAAGDAPAAASAWRQALSFRPDDVQLLAALAIDLNSAGEPQDAVAVLQRALHMAPENGGLHGNLGAIHLGLGQLEDAEVHLRRATQLEPQIADWRVNLVMVFMRQQRWEPAWFEVRRAVDAFPSDERLRRLERILEDRQEIR